MLSILPRLIPHLSDQARVAAGGLGPEVIDGLDSMFQTGFVLGFCVGALFFVAGIAVIHKLHDMKDRHGD